MTATFVLVLISDKETGTALLFTVLQRFLLQKNGQIIGKKIPTILYAINLN